jgi:hypothetical protein
LRARTSVCGRPFSGLTLEGRPISAVHLYIICLLNKFEVSQSNIEASRFQSGQFAIARFVCVCYRSLRLRIAGMLPHSFVSRLGKKEAKIETRVFVKYVERILWSLLMRDLALSFFCGSAILTIFKSVHPILSDISGLCQFC